MAAFHSPGSALSPATTTQGGYISDYSSDYYNLDPVESECLEHYENNLEKYKGKSIILPPSLSPSACFCISLSLI